MQQMATLLWTIATETKLVQEHVTKADHGTQLATVAVLLNLVTVTVPLDLAKVAVLLQLAKVAELPHLAKVERAHIVNVSSLFGIVAVPGQSAYCSTKFAVRGLSDSLGEELRTTSVGLTHVHAGAVATHIMKSAKGDDPELMQRLVHWFERHGMPPARVADRIIRAVEKGARRLLISPEVVLGDLLKRWMPTWGDRVIAETAVRMIGLEDVRARRAQQWQETMVEGGPGGDDDGGAQ